MFCAKCGKQHPDTAAFCQNCGAALKSSTPKKLYFDAKGLTLFNYAFEIRDEAGNICYKAKTVSESMIRYNAKLMTADEKDLIKVSQQSKLTFTSMNFDFLDAEGNVITDAIQKASLFNYTYNLNRFGITMSGNFLKMSFDFIRNGKTIARVDKKILAWGDCYELSFSDPELEQILLAAVLMIQLVCAASRRRR